MDLPTSGRGNDVSGVGGGDDVCSIPPEYYIPVLHDSSNTGAMSGGGATSESMSGMAMVGAGHNQLR